MEHLTLRPARDTDRAVIAAIWHDSASLPEVGVPAMPTPAALRARVDAEFAAGWQVTLAETESDIVGFLALKPADAILAELFLRPERRGQGIGKALLDHAKDRLPSGFTLFTRPSNLPAIRFYEREGLVFLREERHPSFGDRILWFGWRGR